MKLNLKLKTILSVAVFLLVFIALILVATFCDFQISGIMTKGILKDGQYFATDFLGVMLEAVGCTPIYLMIAFVLLVLFWSCIKLWKKDPETGKFTKQPLNIICAVICGIGVAAACWYALKDSVGYFFEHVLARTGDIAGNLKALDKFEHSLAVYGIEAFFGVIMAALAIVATKQFKPETLKKLLRFCLAAACAVALANILMLIIKGPVGRMRYRAIQSDLGASLIADGKLKGYTQWFVANGQPDKNILDTFLNTYGVKDAFKSFPSGHTCSAGTAYTLIMIPTLFGFKEKNKKCATLACWLVPALYTAIVAISRIMVGAHYMSDVTFGGTLAFVCTVIMWEIFICKGSHFFAVFPKLRKIKANGADGEAVEDNTANAAADGSDGGADNDICSVDGPVKTETPEAVENAPENSEHTDESPIETTENENFETETAENDTHGEETILL